MKKITCIKYTIEFFTYTHNYNKWMAKLLEKNFGLKKIHKNGSKIPPRNKCFGNAVSQGLHNIVIYPHKKGKIPLKKR
jgi:hypothetical protein